VRTLRAVWERHYERTAEGKARWRAGPELSRTAASVESPYDTDARHSSKRDTVWTGYQVHVTETCEPDAARLITHVHTTVTTTQDVSCTGDIHQELKGKGLLPGLHLVCARAHVVDAGYVDAELLVSSRTEFGVDLLGPARLNATWQAREGGYDQTRLAVDWEKRQVTCPQGKVSAWWGANTAQPDRDATKAQGGGPAPRVKVRFDRNDCVGCQQWDKCVRSAAGQAPTQVLFSRAQHEALREAGADREREGRAEYTGGRVIEGRSRRGCGPPACAIAATGAGQDAPAARRHRRRAGT
jgi:transposase